MDDGVLVMNDQRNDVGNLDWWKGKQVWILYELVTVNRDAVFLEIIVTVLEPNRFQKIAPIQISAENLHIHWETGKEFCMEDL